MEVWLSYRDTELPIMLPDPIDLKIAPKTIVPEAKEFTILSKLYEVLKDLDECNISFNPIADSTEVSYIKDLINRTEIKCKYVSIEDANVYIDIFRYDPILGFRSSLWSKFFRDDTINKLNIISRDKDKRIFKYIEVDKEKLYIDLILDGGPRLVNIFYSHDGSHYEDALNYYTSRWCLRSDVGNLILASIGGYPWDESIYLFVISLIKLMKILCEDCIGILIGDGRIIDIDPTKLKNISIDDVENVSDFYIYHLVNNIGLRPGVIYYGSLPSTLVKLLGLKKTRDVESYIKALPTRRKRNVLLIEDLTLLYPYKCSMSMD